MPANGRRDLIRRLKVNERSKDGPMGALNHYETRTRVLQTVNCLYVLERE